MTENAQDASSQDRHERNQQIGERIRNARVKEGLTQKELGGLIGRTESSVTKYERGDIEIPLSIMDKIAGKLKVTSTYLTHGGMMDGDSNYGLHNPGLGYMTAMMERINAQHEVVAKYGLSLDAYRTFGEEYAALLTKYGLTHDDLIALNKELEDIK